MSEIDIKENKPFLIHDYFSSLTPHVRSNVGVIHFFEPVGGGAECALNTRNKINDPQTSFLLDCKSSRGQGRCHRG